MEERQKRSARAVSAQEGSSHGTGTDTLTAAWRPAQSGKVRIRTIEAEGIGSAFAAHRVTGYRLARSRLTFRAKATERVIDVAAEQDPTETARWAQSFGLNLGLTPLPNRRVPDALAARLEELIADGKLAPGDRIPPERELATIFAVSRSTMREALNQLVHKGLIDRRPGRGTIVLDRDGSIYNLAVRSLQVLGADLSDALDFRAIMEPAIAGYAARRATRADVVRLEELIRFMDVENSPTSFSSLDRSFHELIARCCRNPLLVRLSELTSTWFDATRDDALQSAERRELSRLGHRRIYVAIASGDAEEAAAAMARHIADIGSVLSDRALGDIIEDVREAERK